MYSLYVSYMQEEMKKQQHPTLAYFSDMNPKKNIVEYPIENEVLDKKKHQNNIEILFNISCDVMLKTRTPQLMLQHCNQR